MWVFTYGSLMSDRWELAFGGVRSQPAVLPGFSRSFNKASERNWGSTTSPGPTLGLEPEEGGQCIGVAFKFPEDARGKIADFLRAREGRSFAFPELLVRLPDSREVQAITPLNDRNAKTYIGQLTIAERAAMARVAKGSHGTAADYVRQVRNLLESLGIEDPHVNAFYTELANQQAASERTARETERHEAMTTALEGIAQELKTEREEASRSEAKKESREKWTIRGLFVTTFVALAALAVSFCSALQQHTDTTAALAKADAANRIMQDTAKRQLQAYLGFSPSAENGLSYQCHFADPLKKSVEECHIGDSMGVVIKNFGATPALNTQICHFFQHSGTPDSFDVKRAIEVAANECGGHLSPIKVLWPGESTIDSVFFTPESLDWLRRSAKGDGATFLIASMTYRDEFGERHRSSLCERLTGNFGMQAAVDCGGGGVSSDY